MDLFRLWILYLCLSLWTIFQLDWMSDDKRNKEELVFIKAAQVWPFVETVTQLGADVVTLSERAGMPLDAVLKKQGLIGERSAWRFIGFAARSLGIENLGYLVATKYPVHSIGELGGMRMRMAPTLGKLLQFFIEDVTYENNGARYTLMPDGNYVVFKRETMFPECAGRWQTEQYMVTIIMQIIGLCAGVSWRPAWLGFASSQTPRKVPSVWSGIELKWGSAATEIAMNESLLQEPVSSAIRLLENHHKRGANRPITSADIDYIVDRQIWSGKTNLDATARELGLSRSTLKRRLGEDKRTYSGIVAKRKQYWAERLLKETDTSVAHIAGTLGYDHVPNFTRAFKARSGVTPSTFRANQQLQPTKAN